MLILPGTVLFPAPAFILAACRDTHFSQNLAVPGHLISRLALITACLGFCLAAWTVKLFMKYGHGTSAPGILPKNW
jgi:hypothetical protein